MIGVRLGPWIIDAEIGRGGMGCVYKAHCAEDAALGPPLAAVKVLAAELAVELGFQQRFQREIDILRQLDHPNIVRFFDSGSENNRYFYAMEYVEGASFESFRDKRGRIPWPEVLDLACQIAPALKHAHDRGIIHRDLKPSNILRTSDPGDDPSPGVVKLTDFGIASLFASPHLTLTGGVIGTPEYLSPEQAAGKQVTRRSDLYSLGIVLYTLVTGKTPFTGDPVDLLHKHRFAQFERPCRVVPDLPADVEEVICNLLAKDPADRPGDAGVLFRRLDSVRKKLTRQMQRADRSPKDVSAITTAHAREGPATMVSRLVRQELDHLDRGGPVQRFFNKPVVLIVMFILCVGTLTWTFWPMSAETLFRKGSALMDSGDPDDWERAWEKYLSPLEEKYPDHPYQADVENYRQQLREAQEKRTAMRRNGDGRLSEAQWFFEKAMRSRGRGDEESARRLFRALVDVFREDPDQSMWVRRAERQLDAEPPKSDGKQWQAVRLALERARALEKEGKIDEARAIRRGLAELYRGDAAAERLLKE